jgi:hypothetical protein
VLKITLLCVVGIYIFFVSPGAGSTAPVHQAAAVEYVFAGDSRDYQVGEELRYEVSYAFFHLGEIRTKVLEVVHKEGATYIRAIAYIDSYSGVPFVDLHAIFQSEFFPAPASRYFVGKSKEDERWYLTTYDFKYDQNKVFVYKGWENEPPEKRDTLLLKGDPQDGLSLFFFARLHSGQDTQIVVPSYVGEKRARAYIKFSSEVNTTDIDSVNYPIKVHEFEGEADFTGIFGLTGGFSGKFSADDAHVPIVAKMNVLIGKVRIELKGWKRDGWQPPRG